MMLPAAAQLRGEGKALSEDLGSNTWSSSGRNLKKATDQDRRQAARGKSPAAPVVEVDDGVEMHQPIGHRRAHGGGVGAVVLAIPGGDDLPPVGQPVFAGLALPDELEEHALHRRRCCGELVEKQEPLAVGRKKAGPEPLGEESVHVRHRQPAEVDGITTGRFDVAKEVVGAGAAAAVHVGGDLRNDVRLADAWLAFDEGNLAGVEEDRKGFRKRRGLKGVGCWFSDGIGDGHGVFRMLRERRALAVGRSPRKTFLCLSASAVGAERTDRRLHTPSTSEGLVFVAAPAWVGIAMIMLAAADQG